MIFQNMLENLHSWDNKHDNDHHVLDGNTTKIVPIMPVSVPS